jgi:hypothetical protein
MSGVRWGCGRGWRWKALYCAEAKRYLATHLDALSPLLPQIARVSGDDFMNNECINRQIIAGFATNLT